MRNQAHMHPEMQEETTLAFAELLSRTLEALREFDRIALRLDPARLVEYRSTLEPVGRTLSRASSALLAEQSGPSLSGSGGQLLKASGHLLKALARFRDAAPGPAGIQNAFLALRSVCRATEEFYPLARGFPAVDAYFLEGIDRGDGAGMWDLPESSGSRGVPVAGDAPPTGLIHTKNQRGQRGGYSLYVPEYYSSDREWPLVVACHGGSGHGADFLWSWQREARARGLLLLVPTASGRTWSLSPPYLDVAALQSHVGSTTATYRLNRRRVLLTGISDGGTFAILNALLRSGGFTHYATIAGAIHAFVGQKDLLMRLKGLPVYQVHGARDWMFRVELAREARDALQHAGAALVYREIEDLSHNYPRDENRHIIRWFLEE